MENYENKKLTKKDAIIIIVSGIVILLSIIASLLFVFQAKTYRVNFATNCDQVVATQKIKRNKFVEEPSISNLGFDLDGWYSEGEKWSFATDKVKKDITLAANWDIHEYSITYDYDGGDVLGTNKDTYTIDDEFDLYPVNKTGHTFVGYKNDKGEVFNKIEKGTTGDLTLKAEYDAIPYNLSVKCLTKYGTINGEGQYTYGSKINLSASLNANFELANWTDLDTLEVVSEDLSFEFTMPARDVNLTIVIKQEAFNITYHDELNVSNSNLTSWMTHSDLELLPLECQYYVFEGWYNSLNEKVEILEQDVKEDIDLYAKWSHEKFNVELLYDKNLLTVTGEGLYAWGEEVTLTATPKEHVTVTDWKDGISGDSYGKDTNTITFTMPKDNISIRTKFAVDTYTVTYLNAYENPNPTEIPYYSSYTLLNPTRENCIFVGWYDDDGNEVTVITNTNKDNIVLTAEWEIPTYTVTISSNCDDFVITGEGTYEIGTKVQLSVDDSECDNNIMFGGWYVDEEVLSSDRDYSFTISQDMDITADFIKCWYYKMEYNGLNYTKRTYNSSNQAQDYFYYEYNNNGQLVRVEWHGTSGRYSIRTYTYNSNGDCLTDFEDYYYDNGNPDGITIHTTYTYDVNNKLIKKLYKYCADPDEITTYNYNDDGDLISEVENGDETVKYTIWFDDDFKYIKKESTDNSYCYRINVYNKDGIQVASRAYDYMNDNYSSYEIGTFENTYNKDGLLVYQSGYSAELYDCYYYYDSNNLLIKTLYQVANNYDGGRLAYTYYFRDSKEKMTREIQFSYSPSYKSFSGTKYIYTYSGE